MRNGLPLRAAARVVTAIAAGLATVPAMVCAAGAPHRPPAPVRPLAPGVLSERALPVDPERARSNFILHCAGCHGMQATGLKRARVPALKDKIGWFLTLPEGRAYLVQVPGVNNAGLDDTQIAEVMNWLVDVYAGPSKPAAFVPYAPAEVHAFRATRPADVPALRRSLGRRLADAGHVVDPYPIDPNAP